MADSRLSGGKSRGKQNFLIYMENLLLQVVSNANLRAAYEQVVKNKGAPGVDGVKTEDLSAYLKTHWLRIRSQILEGTYRPSPVRGVKIP